MQFMPVCRDLTHFKSLRRQNNLFLWLNHWTKEKLFFIWSNRTAYVSLQCGWQPRALKNMFLSSGEHRHQLCASQEVLKQHLMSQVAVKWALLGKSKKCSQGFGNCHFTFPFYNQRKSTLISYKFSWVLQQRKMSWAILSVTQLSWNFNLRSENKKLKYSLYFSFYSLTY